MPRGQEPAFQISKLPHGESTSLRPGLHHSFLVNAKGLSGTLWAVTSIRARSRGQQCFAHWAILLLTNAELSSTDKLRAGAHTETDAFRDRHAPGTPTWSWIYLRHHRKEFSVTQWVGGSGLSYPCFLGSSLALSRPDRASTLSKHALSPLVQSVPNCGFNLLGGRGRYGGACL